MNIFEAMIKRLLAESYDDNIIGKTRDEYDQAVMQHMAAREKEQDAIAAFMTKHNTKLNTGGVLGTKKHHGGRQTGLPVFGGNSGARLTRSVAYGLQARMGVEVHPIEAQGFDAAVSDYSRFLTNGAPRRDRVTEEPKPMDPLFIVKAWKRYFGYIPKGSTWYGRV